MNASRKYRVWDGEEMHEPPHDFQLNGDGSLEVPMTVELVGSLQEYAVMHSTGLTDAEGTEVYEGDIVEHWSHDHSVRVEDPPEGYSRIGVVRYVDAHWWVDFIDPGKMFLSDISNKDSTTQVIGNRHENPELL